MGDIDRALARAYARRGSGDPAGLPSPHFGLGPESDLERSTDAPALPVGASSSLEWPETVRALERQHGPRFDELAEALLDARGRHDLKTLLFTSCHRSEGRTTLVLTLARALARRPGRTLLVDADLAGPMLARSLGLRPRLGLDDVVEDGRSTAEAVVDSPDDHLAVLPLRRPVDRPREFLESPSWSTAFARLRREFDLILIDGGPLFVGLAKSTLPRAVDAAILVHNKALTGPKAILRARELLESGGIPLLGLAETFV